MEYVLCMIGISENSKLLTIPISLIFSTPFVSPAIQSNARPQSYGCFPFQRTRVDQPLQKVEPSMNLWEKPASGTNINESIAANVRATFDIETEIVTFKEIPLWLQQKLGLVSESHEASQRDLATSFVYKIRAVAISKSQQAFHSEIWRYQFYIHAYLPITDGTDGTMRCLRTMAYIPLPIKGSERHTYTVKFGMDHEAVWFTTFGSSSLLLLETLKPSAGASHHDQQSRQSDHRRRAKLTKASPNGSKSDGRQELWLWALAQAKRSEFDLVDLRAGVACAFNDLVLTHHINSPVISVYWFD
ncbi:hypothetical protein FRC17_005757 [Serendipita sp. 399]|nr:hypothetical protein FRC17_005757 [Serendipita sp. 399]